MNKSLNTKLALVFLALACAPCALAQESAAKPSDAVRERRATEAQKPATGEKEKGEKDATETAEADTSAETGGAPGDAAKTPAERARQRQAMAEQLAASGNRAEAVALLRSMLGEERFDAAFFYNTGNALARLGESEAAVEAYRKAVGQRRGNYARAQH